MKEPLPFEDWKEIHLRIHPINEKLVEDFTHFHGVDLQKEIEELLQQEYRLYLEQCEVSDD